MEKNEIGIGTQVKNNGFVIDKSKYNSVSRQHARVRRQEDGIYIEDNDSTNGTFVNGAPIIKKKVTPLDKISLGGPDYYILELDNVLKLLPMSDTEFKQKFQGLKTVYDDYMGKIEKEETTLTRNARIYGILPTTLGSALILACALGRGLVAALISGSVSVVCVVIAGSLSAKLSKKSKRMITQLKEEFSEAYVCPDCRRELGTHRSWTYWQRQGQCPYCKREWK
jgi:ribosomal protein L37AE/L43A